MNDNTEEFRTGAQLLAQWGCKSREEKLERAVVALMEQLNLLHTDTHGQDLQEEIANEAVFCSCADAYRMGVEALQSV